MWAYLKNHPKQMALLFALIAAGCYAGSKYSKNNKAVTYLNLGSKVALVASIFVLSVDLITPESEK
jgi:hypothetical protein